VRLALEAVGRPHRFVELARVVVGRGEGGDVEEDRRLRQMVGQEPAQVRGHGLRVVASVADEDPRHD
jgi:hypothetical protein